MLCILADLWIFFHLTANGSESFDMIISPLNWGLSSTFLISQVHLTYFFILFSMFLSISKLFALPLFFLPMSSAFLVVPSASHLMLTSLVPCIFCSICVPINSTSPSLNNWKLLKFVFLNEGTCNPNCGWLHDIQGKFWPYCWVPEPLARKSFHWR